LYDVVATVVAVALPLLLAAAMIDTIDVIDNCAAAAVEVGCTG
jgi:hypothetical protein